MDAGLKSGDATVPQGRGRPSAGGRGDRVHLQGRKQLRAWSHGGRFELLNWGATPERGLFLREWAVGGMGCMTRKGSEEYLP